MLLKIKYPVFIIFITINYSLNAQDVNFSQLFADRLYLNPAYAGIDYCPRFMLSYRNQWPGINFPYVTYSVSFDKYFEGLHGGVGIRIMKDDQGNGVFNQLSADIMYAYEAKFSRQTSLRFSLETSIYQKSTNVRDLVFYSMIDPVNGVSFPNSENIEQENFFSPDFSVGLLFRHRRLFLGFSANHISQNIVPLHNEYLPLKLIAHAGAILPIDKNDSKQTSFAFEPNIVFINQQSISTLYYGTYFDIKTMSFGLFVRQNLKLHFDALVASYHINFNNFEMAYSYDITLSKFFGQTLGSHEISLVYHLPCDKKIRKYNTISCPSF